MGSWWRRRDRSARRRSRPIGVEAMEGRVLLSAAPHPRHPAPAHRVLLHRADTYLQRADALQALQHRHAQARQARAEPSPATDQPAERSLDNRVQFAVDTVTQGRSMASSKDVRDVGLNYAKLTFSHDSRKVAGAYLKAAIKGNGNAIKRLNHSSLVQKVGDEFTRLSQSKQVQRVGDAFARFGKSVADQFTKLFGPHSHSEPKKKPR